MSALSVIHSRGQEGIHAPYVTVETHLTGGLPAFTIVGLPETAVKESRDRVRSALLNAQFEFPSRKITVNLAPADTPKEGGRFDLPIAMGILSAMAQVPMQALPGYEFAGELALSGELRAIRGVLPFAIACKRAGRSLIIPQENAQEAALIEGLTIYPAKHVLEVCGHLTGHQVIAPYCAESVLQCNAYENDLRDVKGQYNARRALEIAAAGKHSVLFIGPPGTGKTMLASRLPGIMPHLNVDEALQIAALQSISHRGFDIQHWRQRPFRSPHHSASSVALVGGGSPPRPGEISLSHQGVLFLDELPEFNRHVLESLREPLESKTITISRAARQVDFPADFQLVAAMNPCPCGYLGDTRRTCQCSADQIRRYRSRLSGPLLDRIDMHVEVPALPRDFLQRMQEETPEDSETVRARVIQAQAVQRARQPKSNAALSVKQLERHCSLGAKEQELLFSSIEKLKLSTRAYHRVLRVARTIADLGQSEKIRSEDVLEALSYRRLDRG